MRPSYLSPEKPVCGSRTVGSKHGAADWSRMEKGVQQSSMLSPCLFNFRAERVRQTARLHELQAGIKIARKNISNLRYAGDTTLMAESEEELKSLSMRVKEESEKAGLKLSVKKTKIMASSPITSWQIEGRKVEAVTDFLFLGSKSTVDGDCSHELRRCLLLGKKTLTNLNSVLKSKDITLPTKIHIVKAMVFPWWLSGKESICQAGNSGSIPDSGRSPGEGIGTIHASEIPWAEEPGGVQFLES